MAAAAAEKRPRGGGGAGCLKTMARRGLARAIGQIVDALVAKALEGSVPHLKLLMELAGLATGETRVRKGKGVARQLLDEWQGLGAVGGGTAGDGGGAKTWAVVPAKERGGGADAV